MDGGGEAGFEDLVALEGRLALDEDVKDPLPGFFEEGLREVESELISARREGHAVGGGVAPEPALGPVEKLIVRSGDLPMIGEWPLQQVGRSFAVPIASEVKAIRGPHLAQRTRVLLAAAVDPERLSPSKPIEEPAEVFCMHRTWPGGGKSREDLFRGQLEVEKGECRPYLPDGALPREVAFQSGAELRLRCRGIPDG